MPAGPEQAFPESPHGTTGWRRSVGWPGEAAVMIYSSWHGVHVVPYGIGEFHDANSITTVRDGTVEAWLRPAES